MADCKTCKENRKNVEPVPYIVHESDMARQERTIKRLWILLILLIVLFVGSNVAWIVYESQFTDEIVDISQDVDSGDGGDATINDGIHIDGFNGGD